MLLKIYGHRLGFENGTYSDGWGWGGSHANDTAGSIDRLLASKQNPHIEGARSLKVTVLPYDVVDNGARAEVQFTKPAQVVPGNGHFFDGEEIWYHWYTMFPSDLVIPVSLKINSTSRSMHGMFGLNGINYQEKADVIILPMAETQCHAL